MSKVEVAIVMGSDSDYDIMKESAKILDDFGIGCDVRVMSAHRTPEVVTEYVTGAQGRGVKVFIAGAGGAAHLAGAVAAQTQLPVIGVPIDATPLNGMDALLATVQMPPGVPVATVAVGKMGSKNAAILAAQIIGVADQSVAEKLSEYKKNMAQGVIEKDAKIQQLR